MNAFYVDLTMPKGWFLHSLHHQHVRDHYQRSWSEARSEQDGIEPWKVVLCRLRDGHKVEEQGPTLERALVLAKTQAIAEDHIAKGCVVPADAFATPNGTLEWVDGNGIRHKRNVRIVDDAAFEEGDPLDAVPHFVHRSVPAPLTGAIQPYRPKPFPLRLSDIDDEEDDQ